MGKLSWNPLLRLLLISTLVGESSWFTYLILLAWGLFIISLLFGEIKKVRNSLFPCRG